MNGTPARITLTSLARTVASFDQQIRQDPAWTAWTLATSVIGHFLGKEWVLQNIPHREGASSTGFFQMDFSSPERGAPATPGAGACKFGPLTLPQSAKADWGFFFRPTQFKADH